MGPPIIQKSSVFSPLEDGQIRLLQLQPGPSSPPLHCRLDIVTLSDPEKVHYEALSYAWGKSQHEKHVMIGEEKVGITENLYSALFHLRREDGPRTLWVDALSINQTDATEKGVQVRMMGDIFRKSALTWIWLGEASEIDDAVVEYLLQQTDDSDGDEDNNADEGTTAATELAASSFPALHHFYSERPWFRRLWILQEALLSRRPLAKVGSHPPIPFARIVRLRQALTIGNLGNARGDIFQSCYLAPCMREWDALRDHYLAAGGAGGGWPLVYAVPITEQLECALFRDRVFALLGLATAHDRARITPDYEKPLARLQAEVCTHMIATPGNGLAALHTMGGGGGVDGDGRRPSWARDWSQRSEVRWYFIRRREQGSPGELWSVLPKRGKHSQKGYGWLDERARALPWRMEEKAASGGDDDDGAVDLVRFSGDLSTMALKGIVVDAVSSVRVRVGGDTYQNTCENWKNVACEQATGYATGEGLDEAFGNALCHGSYRDDQGNMLTNCAQGYGTWIKGEDVAEDLAGSGKSGEKLLIDYGHRVCSLVSGRAFVVTESGFLGLAPEKVSNGDVVCFFMGCPDPYILRPQQGKQTFLFVGETYIPGMMDGEWIAGADEQKVTEFWIE